MEYTCRMSTVTDEEMRQLLPTTAGYTVVILRNGPRRDQPGADAVIWEHGRRNFQLRKDGQLAIVCPIADESGVAGVGIFTTGPEETTAIMDGDPGVQAGIFGYEVHPCRSFPGDRLPG
jgi:hypothetical protein